MWLTNYAQTGDHMPDENATVFPYGTFEGSPLIRGQIQKCIRDPCRLEEIVAGWLSINEPILLQFTSCFCLSEQEPEEP